ncbi:hypothetical protein FN846DRAFT_892211 [Sphaerosporella brunnea]|uniref:Uncharacterized protein n=1 Tax=Sphaerosporella brunnea TaxID=1250544 RepID=A0A5J5ER42_9PEZI|nr:hypothetical protein FN846DRAFT_892211 [Sphaerosporella brunnea]
MKAAMDTEVVRFCKEKSDLDALIGELMDYDRTSPATSRSPRRIFTSNLPSMEYQTRPTVRFLGHQSGTPDPTAPRPYRDKGKAVDRGNQDRGSQDRKATIQNRPHPETGKMVRSYLNYQGKPVFIKRSCNICEKNGASNQMHFSFECSRNAPTQSRIYATVGSEESDELADRLHRTESGNLTSYTFQMDNVPQEVIYHHESDEEDIPNEPGNRQGGW